MLHSENGSENIRYLEDGQRCLPQMTALFVDGLSGDRLSSSGSSRLTLRKEESNLDSHRFKVPLPSPQRQRISKSEITSFCTRIEKPGCSRRKERPDGDLEKLRSFICGISNCFNNLLMGIWGNVSLMSMTLDSNHPICVQVQNMDRLIQKGALLIHSLLGYIAERRVATRHLRLVQLINEINGGDQNPDTAIDIEQIEKGMKLASEITHPSMVADGMACVLEQLLLWIDGQLKSAAVASSKDLRILKKIKTVDALLKQGFHIVRELKLYTGFEKPKRRKISVKSLVNQQARMARKNFKGINISVDVSDNLKLFRADRAQLNFVLEQLIANAVSAMPEGGNLQVAARPVNEEAPNERCVVHQACDYTVITVSDDGIGMSIRTQMKIFTPFYARNRKSNTVGLGLPAASSIIKRHGGYIQVKSDKKRGSTFKIYLPTERLLPLELTNRGEAA